MVAYGINMTGEREIQEKVDFGWASRSVTALAWGFGWWVGAWCLSVAGPTVAELEVFFSSDYL